MIIKRTISFSRSELAFRINGFYIILSVISVTQFVFVMVSYGLNS
jgi:hypothetical protein